MADDNAGFAEVEWHRSVSWGGHLGARWRADVWNVGEEGGGDCEVVVFVETRAEG